MRPESQPQRQSRWWRRLAVGLALVVGLIAAGGIIWWTVIAKHYGPSDAALAALRGSPTVTVEDRGGWIVFAPREPATAVRFVFYPGAFVSAEAYAPQMLGLAERGIVTYVLRVPLDLALLDAEAAQRVRDAEPGQGEWVVGGHSLGGVAAAMYASRQPSLRGVVFWASYPGGGISLANSPFPALSLRGERDGLLNLPVFEESKPLHPKSTQYELLPGVSHAQFGDYGPQDGDGSPTASWPEARRRIVERTAAFVLGL